MLNFFSLKHFKGTGEHGVGVGKKEYLPNELGEGTVELMRQMKRTIDPLNIMNPGKVIRSQSWPNPFDSCFLQLYPDIYRK